MQRILLPAAWPAIAAVILLAACSSNQQPTPRPVDEEEFSEQDKRAAAALSISNNQAVADAASPYARALLCNNGIETLAERFENAQGPMMEEQLQALEQARTYFGEQLGSLAEREGKSPAELSKDVEETAEQHPDPAENAQMAIACLRRLQEAV